MQDCEEGHFEAQDCIRNSYREVFAGVPVYRDIYMSTFNQLDASRCTKDFLTRVQKTRLHPDGYSCLLPEREENQSFHTQELRHGSEWLEVCIGADPEHCETVKGKRNTKVVGDSDVGVTGICFELTIFVSTGGFQYDCDDCQERLDLYIF